MEIEKKWILLQARLGSPKSLVYLNPMRRIIFFDGVCSLCNGFVDFVIKRDSKNLFKFSSLQSGTATSVLGSNFGLATIVFYDDGHQHIKSTAVLKILFQLGGGWTLFAIFASGIPVILRDLIYNFIAKNRYKFFGRRQTCRLPTETERKLFLE